MSTDTNPAPERVTTLVEAARQWRAARVLAADNKPIRTGELAAAEEPLAAAVDALDQPAQPAPEPDHAFLPVHCHADDDECTHRSDGTDATYCGRPEADHEPAPEPDSGPGWGAASVEAARLAAERDQALRLVAQRDAELAEVTADRNRLREHSTTLNTIAWKIAAALGDVPDGAEQIRGNPVEQTERLMAEVARLRDHADGLADAGDTLIGQRDQAEAEVDRLRGELAIAQRSAADWRERYVPVRRDAAADALEWAAGLDDRASSLLLKLAAEVRASERTIPLSTVPPVGMEAQ